MAIHIRRREFIVTLGSAAAWPLAARAQQSEPMRRIGVLTNLPESDVESQARITVFREGLRKLGWVLGRNIAIDYRWDASDMERARILANSSTVLTAVQRATHTVPVVFTTVSEPVAQGFVASMAHPGGNITGFTNLEPSIGAKWLELLKQIAPSTRRVAIMFNPDSTPIASSFARAAEGAAANFAVEAITVPVHAPAEVEAAMTMLGRQGGGGMILPPDSFINTQRALVIDLAARYRLPAIYSTRYFSAEGGLVSYGVSIADLFRRASAYVDRILRGEKPSNLPVQAPTTFELVINLNAARALGLEIPPTILAIAEEVIE
jgi:putative ABC transport system substrate-binding protein